MEIVLVESANEILVLVFYGLQVDLLTLLVVSGKVVREKDTSVVESFHFT